MKYLQYTVDGIGDIVLEKMKMMRLYSVMTVVPPNDRLGVL